MSRGKQDEIQEQIRQAVAASCRYNDHGSRFSMVTYAEEAIKTVSVTVTSSVEAEADEGTVSATSNSSKYRVVSCDFANSGKLEGGGDSKVNIRLEAEEGYYFNSINAGKATVKGAVYSSAKKETDNHSLILSVKLKGVKGTLGTVESAYWESTPLGKARWSKVENAPAYEVKLYCGDSMVYRVEKTSSTNYDFFSQMTTRGDYYFKVRAVAKTESEADYLKAGEWTESDNQGDYKTGCRGGGDTEVFRKRQFRRQLGQRQPGTRAGRRPRFAESRMGTGQEWLVVPERGRNVPGKQLAVNQ